jgi:cell division transport system permease protein
VPNNHASRWAIAVTALVSKLQRFLRQHAQSARVGLSYLQKSYFATVMTTLVIGIALTLPMGLLVVIDNMTQLSGTTQQHYTLSLFLNKSASEHEVARLQQRLRLHPGIAEIEVISPSDGLRALQQEHGFNSALAYLNENPLPTVFRVYPTSLRTPRQVTQLNDTLAQEPLVALVQFDRQWLQRWHALLKLGERCGVILWVMFSLGVVLIIGNTIRLATQNRRQEIEVVYLLGGTTRFIRRAFLYAGVCYGALGASVAAGFIVLAGHFLASPFYELVGYYKIELNLPSYSWGQFLFIVVLGALLGYLGSWLAVNRELRQLRF